MYRPTAIFIILLALSLPALTAQPEIKTVSQTKNQIEIDAAKATSNYLSSTIEVPNKVLGSTSSFEHSVFDQLLQNYVFPIRNGKATLVDYQKFKKSKPVLDQYLQSVSNVRRLDFDEWSPDERLAFLINVYNAKTIELVLTKYPDLKSIKDLGSVFRSVWSRDVIELLGEMRSLDEIEHKLIRGKDNFSGYGNDPRIHFAVNCASKGCPSLYERAFTGEKLQEQLDRVTKRFLSDEVNNRLERSILRVSKIFDWYAEDFAKGWQGINQLQDFLVLYPEALNLNEVQIKAIVKGQIPIKFIRYDWSLNDGRAP